MKQGHRLGKCGFNHVFTVINGIMSTELSASRNLEQKLGKDSFG